MKPNGRLMGTRLLLLMAAVPLIHSASAWAAVFNPDGATHDPTQQSGWALPAINGSTTDYNNCLRCHQSGGSASDQSAYVFGGHKNMSRKADGMRWGIPGVDLAHAPNLEQLNNLAGSLNPDGSFINLWIQEDYPRMLVNWTTPFGAALSSVVVAYCAKDGTGTISTDDLPDLAACPDCESPVMGNGNAGYPLNYPDAATCAAAASHTGKPYTWYAPGAQPLYWIYGGAGLEGGPAMQEPGSQAYKCGRCHTTGWTANGSTDAAVVLGGTKRPASDFTTLDFTTVNATGSTSKLLGPSFGATAYPVISGGQITSIVMTAKGAMYPTSTPATVTISDSGGGSGCSATAVMAADFYGLYKVNSISLSTTPCGSGYSSATKVSISHPYSLSSWDQWGIQCSRCHVGATGGNHSNPVATDFPTGGDVVALCVGCHRQESDTAPRSIQGGNGFAGNNGFVLPYTNKQQQPDGFAHHPDGNEFLNSPHARFTGNWKDIGCPPYAIFGYPGVDPGDPGAPALGNCTPGTMNLTSLGGNATYASNFARAAKVDLTGVSDSAAGSCVTCHDVHKPHNENTAGMSDGSARGCTDCHSNPAATVSPQINLALLKHPTGGGTPLANIDTDPSSACRTCHQPPGIKHIWRISTDPNYSMYGDYTYAYPVNGPQAMSISTGAYTNNAPGLVNLSNTTPDGTYANAVWIDLDNACGQCHGGGVSETDLTTTGSVTAGSSDGSHINALTVADATGFASGKEVTIAGAGWAGADFKTIIAKVSGNTVYLTYPAITTVSGATVTVAGNPTANNAGYMTKAELALKAKNIHNDAPVVNFSYTLGSPDTLIVNVSAFATCNGPCDAYDWDWGDGSPHGSGPTASHTYASAGPQSITLTVEQRGVSGAKNRIVNVYTPDLGPTVGGTACNAILQPDWSASLTDNSADDNGVALVTIVWGDGSLLATGGQGTTFTHTFRGPGSYLVRQTALDGAGQQSVRICPLIVKYFTISGTVFQSDGTTPVPAATITVRDSTTGIVVKTAHSAVNGIYSAGGLRPGTYTVAATAFGFVFPDPWATDPPAPTITVGPSVTGNDISALP